MQTRRFAMAGVVILLGLATAGCGIFGGGNRKGPDHIDDLLTRIEKVHIQCELSDASAHDAMVALENLTSREFVGDPVVAYDELVKAVDLCERRSKDLKSAVAPMKEAAEPFFDRWANDLSGFSNMSLRLRSQARLEETLERYESLVGVLDPTLEGLKEYTEELRDHVLFLGNDFNASSVAAIEPGVRELGVTSNEVRAQLDACLSAAEDYVRAAALPGQMETAVSEAHSQRGATTDVPASGGSIRSSSVADRVR